jgi:hypothetical protein
MKHTSIHGTKSQTCPQLPYMAQTCPQNILSRLLWRDKILHARKDLMGGCIPKFGPPSIPGPPKKIFQNNFIPQLYSLISPNNFIPEISKIFSEEILHLKKNLQFQNARAPPPQVGPPFFTFNPPPPPPPLAHTPGWHGPGVSDWQRQLWSCPPVISATNIHKYITQLWLVDFSTVNPKQQCNFL